MVDVPQVATLGKKLPWVAHPHTATVLLRAAPTGPQHHRENQCDLRRRGAAGVRAGMSRCPQGCRTWRRVHSVELWPSSLRVGPWSLRPVCHCSCDAASMLDDVM